MCVAITFVFDAVNVRPNVGEFDLGIVTLSFAGFHAGRSKAVLRRVGWRGETSAEFRADGGIVANGFAAGLGVPEERVVSGHQFPARIGERVPNNPVTEVETLIQKRSVMNRPLGKIQHEETAAGLECGDHAVEPGIAPFEVVLIGHRIVPLAIFFFQVVRRIGECEIERAVRVQHLGAFEERNAIACVRGIGFDGREPSERFRRVGKEDAIDLGGFGLLVGRKRCDEMQAVVASRAGEHGDAAQHIVGDFSVG